MISSVADFLPAVATDIVDCPVCGSRAYRVLHDAGDYEYRLPGTFHVAQCKNCLLVYQNPRPPFTEILRYYTQRYEPFRDVGGPLMRALRRRFLVLPRLAKYRKLAHGLGEPVRLLDVGCGQGDVLAMVSQDPLFVCEGVEPVEHAARMAGQRGFNVRCATLEEARYPDGQFHILTMNHVLEHVPDPNLVVAEAYRVLSPGGSVTGETPCCSAIERRIFGRYWSNYHLPRHLTFFTPRLMRRILEKHGFLAVRIGLQPQPSSWQASARNALHARDITGPLPQFFSGHSTLINLITFPFSWLAAALGAAPILHFTARKPLQSAPGAPHR